MENSADALNHMEELLGDSVGNTEDSDISDETNKECEEDLVEESEEQGVLETETPVLLMDLSNKKKVKVSIPPPYEPIPTGVDTSDRDRWLIKGHLGPPAGFAEVYGLHHKIPQAPLPMPAPGPRVSRMVHSSPVYGLSSAEAQELRDLRELVKHPFAWHNMKTIPAKKNATIPVQQPPTSPIMGSPPGESTVNNSAQDFGELNLIHSIIAVPL